MKLNINDQVKVKLTEAGRAQEQAYFRGLLRNVSPGGRAFLEPALTPKEEDDEGYCTFHLHELMNIFGPVTVMGNSRLPFESNEIIVVNSVVDQLDRTADGVPITPQTELWQICPSGFIEDGHPWQCGPEGWTFNRVSDLPVFSSPEAARNSLKEQPDGCDD